MPPQGTCKKPDEDKGWRISPSVIPAKAGIHFSAPRNSQVTAIVCQQSLGHAAERWTPAFAGVTRQKAAIGFFRKLSAGNRRCGRSTNDRNEMPKPLYGPTVEYADGTVVPGQPLDVEQILDAFERLDAESWRAFLCIFAHDLTVAIRVIVFDRPVSDADLDRVQDINESLHQLTSCANPRKEWSAHDQALLLRAIVESSFDRGLDRWIGHALALAAGSAIPSEKPVAAK